MKILIILSLISLLSTTKDFTTNSNKVISSKENRCTSWDPWGTSGQERLLYLKICEYSSGGSGYIKFKNSNNQAVRISYKLTFNNGKTQTGSTNISANSETNKSSCFNCAQKNSGVKYWSLTKIAFEGEEGYW
ncbi:MAG: hypothetical protein COA32_03800 [Fluviicola sp.]|nr:MAG: hypothetical protein COA32_03800 [Fluviicola sp.]